MCVSQQLEVRSVWSCSVFVLTVFVFVQVVGSRECVRNRVIYTLMPIYRLCTLLRLLRVVVIRSADRNEKKIVWSDLCVWVFFSPGGGGPHESYAFFK